MIRFMVSYSFLTYSIDPHPSGRSVLDLMHDRIAGEIMNKMDCNFEGIRQIIYQYFFYSSQVLSPQTVMNVTFLAIKPCNFERFFNLPGNFGLVDDFILRAGSQGMNLGCTS